MSSTSADVDHDALFLYYTPQSQTHVCSVRVVTNLSGSSRRGRHRHCASSGDSTAHILHRQGKAAFGGSEASSTRIPKSYHVHHLGHFTCLCIPHPSSAKHASHWHSWGHSLQHGCCAPLLEHAKQNTQRWVQGCGGTRGPALGSSESLLWTIQIIAGGGLAARPTASLSLQTSMTGKANWRARFEKVSRVLMTPRRKAPAQWLCEWKMLGDVALVVLVSSPTLVSKTCESIVLQSTAVPFGSPGRAP